jgi:peptidoglycan/LPS O-acetylase OafA/YrhL
MITDSNHSYFHLFQLAHFVVICLFILSGFVIAHTTSVKKNFKRVKEYAIARLSRLYSIHTPAIIITVCLRAYPAEVFREYDNEYLFLRSFMAFTFTNELWLLSSEPAFNAELWYLNYEL